MTKTLIKGGQVISMDPEIGQFDKGDVLIDGEKIVEVAVKINADDVISVDASRMIVMPGLVDSHIHTWQTGIRGIAGNWTMGQYLRGMHANLAAGFKPEDIYLGNLAGALTQINGGVTTILDWCHNNPTPDHTNAAIDGLFESGIRALFGHGSPKPDPKKGQKHFSEIPHPASEINRLLESRLSQEDTLVTLGMCILGPHYSTYDVTSQDMLLAKENGLLASAHMSGGFNRLVPDGIYKMKEDGLLSPKFNVVHGNDLSDEELKILVDHGVKMTVTPEVEIQMGFGDPITGRVMSCGGRPSIGVDVESNIAGDMFNVMRMALQIQRMIDNRPFADARKPIESLSISPLEALEWATINGAEMLGLENKIGSLTPGKQADIILIRADDFNLHPVNDPVNAVVFYANASNVDTVYIAGKLKKKGGKLAYENMSDIMAKLADSGARILANSNASQLTH
ncbi:MAG: amidohydrolase family protein [Rhodospirillales bacterium]|nr:amidohydrolase family protein [Rhodospirillales bacterium]